MAKGKLVQFPGVRGVTPQRNAVIVELLPDGRWAVSIEVKDGKHRDALNSAGQRVVEMLQLLQ